jgi:mannose-6-phosphate isomerase
MNPLIFEPYFRPQVWGGRRLESFLGRPLPGDMPIGEAWMLSGQSLHVSRVAEGPWKGMLLTELWQTRVRDLVGPAATAALLFPLLFKYLDCQQLLSVQVHPSDRIAERLRPGEPGKTEAWVVLDAEPGARVYAGLQPGTTREELERRLDAGTVAECLHSFAPRKGDCLFLPAGLVHAVGGGVLIAEVQQSSDATFRLFDWNRLGPDGKPRALHREEALQSIDWAAGAARPVAGSPIGGLPEGNLGERLVDCPYFVMDRFRLAGAMDLPYRDRMSIWMVLEGPVELSSTTGYCRRCARGETTLVPATAGELRWTALEAPAVLLAIIASP